MHKVVREKFLEVVEARNAVFRGKARNRPLTEGYEEIGMLGEWEFGRWSGIFPRTKPGGDGGYDFQVPVVFTVDVKSSKRGDVLFVEAGKVKADIYVLAHVAYGEEVEVDSRTVWADPRTKLVGWCFASQVKAMPAKDSGRGIINHTLSASELRPMEELRRMMGEFKRG